MMFNRWLRRTGTPCREEILAHPASLDLAKLISDYAIIPGQVRLSSGIQADFYLDLRRVTLHHAGAPRVGMLLRALTRDWPYTAVGGLTLGADPIATAMLHDAAKHRVRLDAFVVRAQVKPHGLQRWVEGPEVADKRVLVVEDTATTGASVLRAVGTLVDAGAVVVGVAVLVDRDNGAREVMAEAGLPYRYLFGLDEMQTGP